MTSQINHPQPLNGSNIHDDDVMWMREAITQAKIALAKHEVPIGAILIHQDEVIGRGYNQAIQLHDPTSHAELMALREGAKAIRNYRLLNTTLYVTLEPCLMCVGALIHARIKRLVFGAHDLKAGAVNSKLQALEFPFLNHRVDYVAGILSQECGKLLSDFFAARRRENTALKSTS
jgi:tRNA(adenine34) deaminase